jgi:hypothetical protein
METDVTLVNQAPEASQAIFARSSTFAAIEHQEPPFQEPKSSSTSSRRVLVMRLNGTSRMDK